MRDRISTINKRSLWWAAALCVVATVSSVAQSNSKADALLDNAFQAMVATRYSEAGKQFEAAAAQLGGTLKFETLYRAGLAWVLSGDSASLHRSSLLIDRLLIEAEPEEPTYHRSMLLQAWISALNGNDTLARQQLHNAESYLPPDEIPRALWICSEMLTMLGNRFAADSCSKMLQAQHPNSLEARYSNKSGSPGSAARSAQRAQLPLQPANSTPAPAPAAAVSRPRNTPSTTAASAAAEVSGGEWVLQLGAFANRANADALHKQLSFLPGTLKVTPLEVEGKKLFALRIHSFKTREEAEEFRNRVLVPQMIDSQLRQIK